MKNKLAVLAFSSLVMASPMLAQGATDASGNSNRLAAGYIAVGIASGLCGLGQGRATASAAEAMARNPGAIAAIRTSLIIGLVLIESLALYALMASAIVK